MGFSAKPAELLELEKVRQDGIPVLRRYTGGGTVIVDHNTFFASFVMNVSHEISNKLVQMILIYPYMCGIGSRR